MTSALESTYLAAANHLCKHDAHLVPIIERTGLCTIQPHANYYQDLVESIIGQQLSIAAAATIIKRFKGLFDDTLPTPEHIIITPIETIRTAGLSNQKANYVRDLAQHILDGTIDFTNIDTLSNETVIKELTKVKGIGEWTAHMFLMFCMGRLDVLAHGDLGIRNGVKQIYSLDHLPSPQEVKDVAHDNHWQPYASVACWYIWQALDAKPVNT